VFTWGGGAPGIRMGPPRSAKAQHGLLCLAGTGCQPPDTSGMQAVPSDVGAARGSPGAHPRIVVAVPRCLPMPGTLLVTVAWACTPPASGTTGVIEQFQTLHEPVVRAQGLRLDAANLHEHLARSFDGEALTRGFLAASSTARMRQHEGARVEVQSVVYEAIDVRRHTMGVAELDATWLVTGSVHHGDHSHRRATRYAARYRMSDTPRGLRITDERARDAVRLPAAPPRRAGAIRTALELRGVGP